MLIDFTDSCCSKERPGSAEHVGGVQYILSFYGSGRLPAGFSVCLSLYIAVCASNQSSRPAALLAPFRLDWPQWLTSPAGWPVRSARCAPADESICGRLAPPRDRPARNFRRTRSLESERYIVTDRKWHSTGADRQSFSPESLTAVYLRRLSTAPRRVHQRTVDIELVLILPKSVLCWAASYKQCDSALQRTNPLNKWSLWVHLSTLMRWPPKTRKCRKS